MTADARAGGRTVVSWLALATAVAASTVLVVEGPPGSGYGWGSVVVSCLVVSVPLVAIGLMVRTSDRRYAWATAALAALLGFFSVMALVGNWSGQSSTNHVLDLVSTVLMSVTAVGSILVELPLLRQHVT